MTLVSLLTVVLIVATAAATFYGGWLRGEKGAREFYLTGIERIVARAVREAMDPHLTDISDASKLISRTFGSEVVEYQAPNVIGPPPTPEEQATAAYTQASMAEIRAGLENELGLSGAELASAMQDVERAMALNPEL